MLKSSPTVLVMKAAQNRSCCNGTEALDRSMEWRIFVQ
jgi:hypothetical protein